MKKLCSIIATLSIISFSTINVIACNNGISTAPNYTDEEKMIGIRNLTHDMLVDNGVKIKRGISDDDIDALIEAFELTELIENNEDSDIAILLKSSLSMYIMANSLLNEISAKVPGYGWIANKLTWQSQWALKDLIENEKLGATNNVSGWMPTINSWSLSVTFLNEDKTGWGGEGDPFYARININKKLVATENGDVCTEENYTELGCTEYSNPEAVWNDGKTSAKESIQHPEVGSIYQGYASSSKLINLDGIFVDEVGKVTPGIVNFSPSATDFVNNLIYELDFPNIILANSKKEIEEQLNDYLKNEPIYLNEGLQTTDLNIRFKNQIYIVLFTRALDRRNLKNEDGTYVFEDDDLTYSNILMAEMFDSLLEKLDELLKNISTSSEKYQTISEFKTFVETMKVIDETETGLTSDQISEFKTQFENVVKISRNESSATSNEFDFAKEEVNINLFKQSAVEGTERQNLSSTNDYFDFGFDDSYKFEIQYWARTNPEISSDQRWYKPDEEKTNKFVADSGFRNIFLKQRITAKNDLLNKYNNAVGNNGLTIDPFGFNENGSDSVEDVMKKSFEKAISLDPENQYPPLNYDPDSWRIYHLTNLVNNELNNELRNLFGIKIEGGSVKQTPKIWDQGVSLDGDTASPQEKDDDIAFGLLLNYNHIPLSIVDLNTSKKSEFSESIYENGLDIADGQTTIEFKVIYGTTNSYGIRNDSTINYSQWWSQTSRVLGSVEISLKVPDQYFEELKEYWDIHVRNNKDNPDYKIPTEDNY